MSFPSNFPTFSYLHFSPHMTEEHLTRLVSYTICLLLLLDSLFIGEMLLLMLNSFFLLYCRWYTLNFSSKNTTKKRTNYRSITLFTFCGAAFCNHFTHFFCEELSNGEKTQSVFNCSGRVFMNRYYFR